ncbi:hypothetical protein BH09ACT1_BH09ACT1_27240 [soil metagenome]
MSRHVGMTSPRAARGAALIAAAAIAILCIATQLVPSTSAGFQAKITNSKNTAATAGYFTCLSALAADKSSETLSYPLNEAAATTSAADNGSAGTNTGTYRGAHAITTTTPIACTRDTVNATVFDGTSSYVSSTTQIANPTTYSLEVWFKTTVAGGKLIGFGNAQTGASTTYDRELYINSAGAVTFGTYNTAVQTVTSPTAYNNGAWHQAIATMSPTTGMALWLDGTKVASSTTFVNQRSVTGYWRVGYDANSVFPLNGASLYFTGSMRFASVFTTVLTAAQISNHYAAGR